METVKPSKETFYALEFSDGERILMPKEILTYFKTLEDMVLDFQDQLPVSKEGYPIIPITAKEITPSMISAMISFYILYNREKVLPTWAIQDALENERIGDVDKERLYRQWVFILGDEYELAEMIKSADYLRAAEIVVMMINRLYQDLEKRDTLYLEKRFNAILKRKPEYSLTTEEGHQITRLYRRAKLIKDITANLLTQDLVRGIDGRIQKYTNLVLDSEAMSFIRYGKDNASVFVRRNYTSADLVKSESLIAFEEGEKLLETEKINEIIVGETFYGLLNDKGEIAFFGELVLVKEKPTFTFSTAPLKRDAVLLDRNPVGEVQDNLGLWSGERIFVVLSSKSLFFSSTGYVITSRVNVSYKAFNIQTSDILDVSCGDKHALILTRKGLYGWGDNNAKQLINSEYSHYFGDPIFIEPPTENDEIQKIFCHAKYSLVLTKSGKLYAKGSTITKPFSYLGLTSNIWQEILLDEKIDRASIQLISGSKQTFIVVAANRVWHSLFDSRRIDYALDFIVDGEIRQVFDNDDYTLIVTDRSVYLRGEEIFAAQFGGSESPQSPYKLKFSLSTEESITTSNKKQRISCLKCFAEPRFFSKKKSALFCSRYCYYQ